MLMFTTEVTNPQPGPAKRVLSSPQNDFSIKETAVLNVSNRCCSSSSVKSVRWEKYACPRPVLP